MKLLTVRGHRAFALILLSTGSGIRLDDAKFSGSFNDLKNHKYVLSLTLKPHGHTVPCRNSWQAKSDCLRHDARLPIVSGILEGGEKNLTMNFV